MSVIPLTLIISLCLVFTFLVFFLREHSRSRLSSSERDSMLPFGEETRTPGEGPALVVSFKGRDPKPKHLHSGVCSENKPDHERCPDCSRRHSS